MLNWNMTVFISPMFYDRLCLLNFKNKEFNIPYSQWKSQYIRGAWGVCIPLCVNIPLSGNNLFAASYCDAGRKKLLKLLNL